MDEARLYRALCWEASLWVTCSGVDVNAAMMRHNSAAILQLVAGLGPRKARLLTHLIESKGGNVTDRFHLESLLRVLEHHVIANALPVLRVSSQHAIVSARDDEALDEHPSDSLLVLHHPLDATLVPPSWYSWVESVSQAAFEGGNHTGVSAVAALFAMTEEERFQKLKPLASTPEEAYGLLNDEGLRNIINQREADFVIDELISAGNRSCADLIACCQRTTSSA